MAEADQVVYAIALDHLQFAEGAEFPPAAKDMKLPLRDATLADGVVQPKPSTG